jgi:hypothetical protein
MAESKVSTERHSPGAERKGDVGYKRPPVHSRFKPGQSGNPAGRAKGSANFRTLFQKILKEEVSLREGTVVRKVSKAEAVLRGMVVGAMKGDPRSLGALFKLAEQTGQLEEAQDPINRIERIIVSWEGQGAVSKTNPGNSDISRD